MVIRCIEAPENPIFTAGQTYLAKPIPSGALLHVRDNLGHARFVPLMGLRFIVLNTEEALVARFEVVNG